MFKSCNRSGAADLGSGSIIKMGKKNLGIGRNCGYGIMSPGGTFPIL